MQNLALALVLAFVGGVGALLSLDMPRITRADGYVVNDHPIAKIHAPQGDDDQSRDDYELDTDA